MTPFNYDKSNELLKAGKITQLNTKSNWHDGQIPYFIKYFTEQGDEGKDLLARHYYSHKKLLKFLYNHLENILPRDQVVAVGIRMIKKNKKDIEADSIDELALIISLREICKLLDLFCDITRKVKIVSLILMDYFVNNPTKCTISYIGNPNKDYYKYLLTLIQHLHTLTDDETYTNIGYENHKSNFLKELADTIFISKNIQDVEHTLRNYSKLLPDSINHLINLRPSIDKKILDLGYKSIKLLYVSVPESTLEVVSTQVSIGFHFPIEPLLKKLMFDHLNFFYLRSTNKHGPTYLVELNSKFQLTSILSNRQMVPPSLFGEVKSFLKQSGLPQPFFPPRYSEIENIIKNHGYRLGLEDKRRT